MVIKIDHKGRRHIICSTDLTLNAAEILDLYEARFQIEFLFRDAKQYTGLGHSQVLDSQGQEHFANSSLTALNLLRIEDHTWAYLRERASSIGSLKLRKYNRLVVNRFIAFLGAELKPEKIKQACEQAYQTGLLAA